MTNITPPFDPPYITSVQTKDGIVRIETLTDGSARPVPADSGARPSLMSAEQPSAPPSPQAPGPQAKRVLAGGNDRATVFLDVPFSAKDDAKRLGAKWDGQMRKWYVPHGLDINLFSRWWPDGLKVEMAPFGKL